MSTSYTTTIPETDCIGDSLDTINTNFDNLGNALFSATSATNAFSVVDTSTIDLSFNNATRTLSASIVPGSVGTVQLSSGAVTANKISLVTSLGLSGYQIMPGGLIMQWGQVTSNGTETTYNATFPIAFPTACLQVVPGVNLSTWSSLSGANFSTQVSSTTTTGVTLYLQAHNTIVGTGTVILNYIAIGF